MTDKEWVKLWRRTAPELDRVRIRELRSFNHGERWQTIDDMLSMGQAFARPRSSSGLVEWQRWLARKAKT